MKFLKTKPCKSHHYLFIVIRQIIAQSNNCKPFSLLAIKLLVTSKLGSILGSTLFKWFVFNSSWYRYRRLCRRQYHLLKPWKSWKPDCIFASCSFSNGRLTTRWNETQINIRICWCGHTCLSNLSYLSLKCSLLWHSGHLT